jgi:divalent metal cation (Fe/Co/Zn/Cd) transporter
MFSLSFAKGRVGHELSNAVLVTESKVTLIDGYLAVAVLAGLVLNAMAGWWWADPLAGLVIVYYGFVEGTRALQESRGAA